MSLPLMSPNNDMIEESDIPRFESNNDYKTMECADA